MAEPGPTHLCAFDDGLPPGAVDAAAERLAAQMRVRLPQVLRAGFDDPQVPLLRETAAMLAPAAAAVAAAEAMVDPATAPEAALPWLAAWIGWEWLFCDAQDPRRTLAMDQAFPPGPERLRALLVAFPYLQGLQGRAECLAETLRIATGAPEINVEQDVATQHLTVWLPRRLAPMRPWIARLARAERPAHLTCDIALLPDREEPAS